MIIGWVIQQTGFVTLYPSEPRWTSLAGRRTNRLLLTNQIIHARSHARLHRATWRIRALHKEGRKPS